MSQFRDRLGRFASAATAVMARGGMPVQRQGKKRGRKKARRPTALYPYRKLKVSQSRKWLYTSPSARRAVKIGRFLFRRRKESSMLNRKEYGASLFVFKEVDTDDERWVLLSSNGFRDRDGEIISTKALEQDVAMWDLMGAPPDPLRWWHVSLDEKHEKGIELGYVDFRMVKGHTLIESGKFISPIIAAAVKEAAPQLAGSIGFRYPSNEPDTDKVFHTIRSFERSLLPKEAASNLLTHLSVV